MVVVLEGKGINTWVDSKRLAHCYPANTLSYDCASMLVLLTYSTYVLTIVVSRTRENIISIIVSIWDIFLDIIFKVIIIVVSKFV